MLEDTIITGIEGLATKYGYKTPYLVTIVPRLEPDKLGRERIVAIKAGNPPTIIISRIFIILATSKDRPKGIPSLRETIIKILDYLPKMQHTLAVTPLANAIALRQSSKRWARANKIALNVSLPDSCFDIKYTVTVTEKVTGVSIKTEGGDLDKAVAESKLRLSRMILEQEELAEIVEDKLDAEESKKKEIKPNEVDILISGGGEVDIKMEY